MILAVLKVDEFTVKPGFCTLATQAGKIWDKFKTVPNYYTYLISSLPVLHFGANPPFSFESFIDLCGRSVSESGIRTLKEVSISGEYRVAVATQPALEKYRSFDTALRNELVKTRASRKHIDPYKYMRGDSQAEASVRSTATRAQRNPSVTETERILDQARWGFLDEIAFGHYFDLDFLIAYAHKLLILERWKRINASDRHSALERALQSV